MPIVMLIGAGGQVGQAILNRPLPDSWNVLGFAHGQLDVTNPAAVRDAFQEAEPDFVINAAAMTKVDEAEGQPDLARKINFEGPACLAAQCSTRDIPLLHLSSDYVFDGAKKAPYEPDDVMNPLNAYGESKMMGEEAIRHELPWHIILRVSWVFSQFGSNILTNTLGLIDGQDEIRMVNDQIGAPTPADSVAQAVITMADKVLGGKCDGFGTFHFCGAPPCSRYVFTEAVIEAYGSKKPKLIPVESDSYASFARRPLYSVLECSKICNAYGLSQPDWREGIVQAIGQIKQTKG